MTRSCRSRPIRSRSAEIALEPKAGSDPLELERDRRLDPVRLDEADVGLRERRSADRPADRHHAEAPIADHQWHRHHRADQLLDRAGKRLGDGDDSVIEATTTGRPRAIASPAAVSPIGIVSPTRRPGRSGPASVLTKIPVPSSESVPMQREAGVGAFHDLVGPTPGGSRRWARPRRPSGRAHR